MDVFGKVIEVAENVTIAKNGGGSYKGVRFTYRDTKDDSIKERGIHENALKYNPTLKASLSELKSGEDFTMTLEKEGEFWNIKGLIKGNVPTNTPAKGPTQSFNATPKSTYETAEERAYKQICIVRQSSITQALTFINQKAILDNNSLATVEDIIAVAKQFEAHVFRTESGVDAIFNMESDIL